MAISPDHSLARHQRIYRILLLAYPKAFRQVYGADMLQVFGDRLREERARSGRRASARVWVLTLLDLFRSAPVQRMERRMSREAAFGILLALFLAFAMAMMTGVAGDVGSVVGLGVLALAAIGLGVGGAFRPKNGAGREPAGRLGPAQWWVVLATAMGLVEIAFGIGQLVSDPKIENVGALAVLGAAGLLALTGCWFRSRSRSSGDWMIVAGLLPFLALFWMILPPILGIIVITMAIIDSTRRAPVRVS